MRLKRRLHPPSVLLALVLVLWQPITFRTLAQDEDQSRDIQSTEVTRGRRRGKKPQPGWRYRVKLPSTTDRTSQGRRVNSPRVQDKSPNTFVQQFPVGAPPKGKSYMTLGITLWRVRLTTEAESRDPKVPKESMTWDQQEHEVVATRISDENSIPNQDLLQVSIEYLPDRDGLAGPPSNLAVYLYVINREQFVDGSLKNARLIFPTMLTYGGDNRVLPGKTVILPGPKRPFRIKRSASGPMQSYETYTIILSPVPLDDELPREIGREAMNLPADLIANWERQMDTGPVRADLRGGLGQSRTQSELVASGNPDKVRGTEDPDEELTTDDLPPQTVFRSVVKPGGGMLVTVRLPFKDPIAKP